MTIHSAPCLPVGGAAFVSHMRGACLHFREYVGRYVVMSYTVGPRGQWYRGHIHIHLGSM